jgi:hypothetical protein
MSAQPPEQHQAPGFVGNNGVSLCSLMPPTTYPSLTRIEACDAHTMYTSHSPTIQASTTLRYKYQPLHRSSKGLLRLLRVLPSRLEGRLQVELRLCDWSTEYRCLSYMWGEPSSENHEVLLDGCLFSVRDNLYRFLELASSRYPQESLWIDAVCIRPAPSKSR